jgi:hypothetical protein
MIGGAAATGASACARRRRALKGLQLLRAGVSLGCASVAGGSISRREQPRLQGRSGSRAGSPCPASSQTHPPSRCPPFGTAHAIPRSPRAQPPNTLPRKPKVDSGSLVEDLMSLTPESANVRAQMYLDMWWVPPPPFSCCWRCGCCHAALCARARVCVCVCVCVCECERKGPRTQGRGAERPGDGQLGMDGAHERQQGWPGRLRGGAGSWTHGKGGWREASPCTNPRRRCRQSARPARRPCRVCGPTPAASAPRGPAGASPTRTPWARTSQRSWWPSSTREQTHTHTLPRMCRAGLPAQHRRVDCPTSPRN